MGIWDDVRGEENEDEMWASQNASKRDITAMQTSEEEKILVNEFIEGVPSKLWINYENRYSQGKITKYEAPDKSLRLSVLKKQSPLGFGTQEGISLGDFYESENTSECFLLLYKDGTIFNHRYLEWRNERKGLSKDFFAQWAKKLLEHLKEREKYEQQVNWRKRGLCYWCGGSLSFLLRKCKSCGMQNR